MMRERISVAILAGGEGRRIGGGKPSLALGSMSLLERAFARASDWTDSIRIVVRSPSQLSTMGMPHLVDRPDVEGPLGGLTAGLEWANSIGADYLLTIPCDMPFLPSDLAQRLVGAVEEAAAAIASSNDQLHPVCGLWRSELTYPLKDYASTGRRSLKGFVDSVGFNQVDWTTDPVDPFFNINSPSDLRAAQSLLGG